MASPSTPPLIRYVRHLAGVRPAAQDTDRQLLERFARDRDEAAFAALVRRHGPLVLGVCRRVLGDRHDAEDAFQATFLVLARKAGALRRPEGLGPWLYGVASRIARKARCRAARRRWCERRWAGAPAARPADDPASGDLRPVLDEAVARLPEKYRVPFVLCYLQGRTVSEAAGLLGWPRSTVATRLGWARGRLRELLRRRGVVPTVIVLPGLLARDLAAPGVPAPLLDSTVEAAVGAAAGRAAVAESVPVRAAALAQGGLRTMATAKVTLAVTFLTMLGAASGGAVMLAQTAPAGKPAAAAPAPAAPKEDLPAPPQNGTAQQQAEKDYRIAEFYRRTGHPASACFYYEVVRRRYRGTVWAERAMDRMRGLQRPEGRKPAGEDRPVKEFGS